MNSNTSYLSFDNFYDGKGYYFTNFNNPLFRKINFYLSDYIPKWQKHLDINGFQKNKLQFNQNGLSLVQKYSHYVSPYFGQATKAYLILCHPSSTPLAMYWIPSSEQLIIVRHRFALEYYQYLTIFEGFFLTTPNQSFYVINDILYLYGNMVGSVGTVDKNTFDLRKMLRHANEMFTKKKYIPDSFIEPLTIKLNRYLELQFLASYHNQLVSYTASNTAHGSGIADPEKFGITKSSKNQKDMVTPNVQQHISKQITGYQFRSVHRDCHRLLILELKSSQYIEKLVNATLHDESGKPKESSSNIHPQPSFKGSNNETKQIKSPQEQLNNLLSRIEITNDDGYIPIRLMKQWHKLQIQNLNYQHNYWFRARWLGPDTYVLIHKNKIIGLAYLTPMYLSQYINTLNSLKDIRFRCQYIPKFKKWKPIAISDSKSTNIIQLDDSN